MWVNKLGAHLRFTALIFA